VPAGISRRLVKIDGDGTAPPASPAREELVGTWRWYYDANAQWTYEFTIQINAATNRYELVMPTENGEIFHIGNIQYDGTTWRFTFSDASNSWGNVGYTVESELTKEITDGGNIEFFGQIDNRVSRWVKVPPPPAAAFAPLAAAFAAVEPEPDLLGGWQWYIDGTVVAELDITRVGQYAVVVSSLDSVTRFITNIRYANRTLTFDCTEDGGAASSYSLNWNAADDSFGGRVNEVDHLWERL
jgi:hypothetical protein